MSNKNQYEKIKGKVGLYKHKRLFHFLATKKVNGLKVEKTFKSLYDARKWRTLREDVQVKSDYATLGDVWMTMQDRHFPTLAYNTRVIWRRRFELLEDLSGYPMNELTSSVLTSWVEQKVKYFKSDEYENLSRGMAKRCNLDNELNLLTTIFNWYKQSEEFEKEAIFLVNPVKMKHKKLGFIKAKPVKNLAIKPEDAVKFFEALKPLYQDVAIFQYLTASRISEVAGLQWNRVNFERKTITVMETACWDLGSKVFIKLNPHPKNKEPRPVYMTDELYAVLKRREAHKVKGCEFVFHADGRPLNYCTIQLNYREGQRKSRIPYTGTHILRHGAAQLARRIGGGLDAVIAMTGHKDFKLADHYSKMDMLDRNKEIGEKFSEVFKSLKSPIQESDQFSQENVLSFRRKAN